MAPLIDRRRLIATGALLAAGWSGAGLAARRTAPAPLPLSDISVLVDGLENPEGIAALRDGRIFFSSGGGAIGVREADGRIRHVGAALAPNGVAIDAKGRAIVANMGLLKNVPGTLQRIDVTTGAVETLADTIEGRALVASNGPAVARDGTIYCTHSSWGPISNIGASKGSGFLYMVAPDGRRQIVARDLRGVNGLCLDAGERYVYASLTAEARIRRWRRLADGTLGPTEEYGPQLGLAIPDQTVREILAMPAGDRATLGYCDGIAFDRAGNLWITLPFSNRIIALTPAGGLIDIVHDPEARLIDMPTNLCWSGSRLDQLLIVSRRGGRIVSTRTATPGLPLAHWRSA